MMMLCDWRFGDLRREIRHLRDRVAAMPDTDPRKPSALEAVEALRWDLDDACSRWATIQAVLRE